MREVSEFLNKLRNNLSDGVTPRTLVKYNANGLYFDKVSDGRGKTFTVFMYLFGNRKDNNVSYQFSKEPLKNSDSSKPLTSDLYELFKNWCEAEGLKVFKDIPAKGEENLEIEPEELLKNLKTDFPNTDVDGRTVTIMIKGDKRIHLRPDGKLDYIEDSLLSGILQRVSKLSNLPIEHIKSRSEFKDGVLKVILILHPLSDKWKDKIETNKQGLPQLKARLAGLEKRILRKGDIVKQAGIPLQLSEDTVLETSPGNWKVILNNLKSRVEALEALATVPRPDVRKTEWFKELPKKAQEDYLKKHPKAIKKEAPKQFSEKQKKIITEMAGE